jgi:hypothetical protein
LGAGSSLAVKVIPVRVNAYEFRDFIQEECRFAATRNKDEDIYKRIVEKAKELRFRCTRRTSTWSARCTRW